MGTSRVNQEGSSKRGQEEYREGCREGGREGCREGHREGGREGCQEGHQEGRREGCQGERKVEVLYVCVNKMYKHTNYQ